MAARSTHPFRAGAADLALVLVFSLIGRASHHEPFSVAGLLVTWWPFAVGTAAGWIAASAARIRIDAVAGGIVVAVFAVGAGMLLRVASGQSVQPSFVVVASIVLLLFLVGWRVIARFLVRRHGSARPQA